jgi:exodeoxyribonuclease-5
MAMIAFDDLSPQQREAVEKVSTWWKSAGALRGVGEMPGMPGSQTFYLAGFAGTGKTSIAQTIVSYLGLSEHEVIYSAFTGKACHVLRTKGCRPVTTLHSLIYTPVDKFRAFAETETLEAELENGVTSQRQALIEKRLGELHEEMDAPGWILNPTSDLARAKLLVVDEVSMVNERLAADLLSFKVPVLVLGDPAQLPPVAGNGYFTSSDPDMMLTQIHRYALESPITSIATTVRTHTGGLETVTGLVESPDGSKPPSGRWHKPLTAAQAARFDVVLCWRNDTRWHLTRKLRAQRGYKGGLPNVGEKIIVLTNNRDLAVYNGQIFTVQRLDSRTRGSDRNGFTAKVSDDEGGVRTLPLVTGGFANKKTQEDTERRSRFQRTAAVATFAHVITVHKFQGSEESKILVIDESAGVARAGGADQARQWGYTAITRASTQAIITSGIV